MDKYNQAILELLRQNARLSWSEIGKQVFLTGQAVGARAQHMQEQGFIQGYTLRESTDVQNCHFISVYMRSNDFAGFEQAIRQSPLVTAAYKLSGEACYQIIAHCPSTQDLDQLTQIITPYATYKIASTLNAIK